MEYPRYRSVQVADGLGVVEGVVDDDGFTLTFAGDPIAFDSSDDHGSLGWLARRLVPQPDPDALHLVEAWTEPAEWDELRQWLRHVEPDDDPVGPLRPLLRLLAPGEYGVAIGTLPNVKIVGAHPTETSHWYAGDMWYAGDVFGPEPTPILPTHHWPPPDRPAVTAYRQQMEAQRCFPALVVFGHRDSPVWYLLDGHHKLEAYQRLGRDPVAVMIAVGGPGPMTGTRMQTEPSLEYTPVGGMTAGTGVIAVSGSDGASVLRLMRRPYIVEGYMGGGTVDRLAVLSGDPKFRVKVGKLRKWLRRPDSRSLPTMLCTMLDLLAPGCYGVRHWIGEGVQVLPFPPNRMVTWYPGITTDGKGTVLLPTDEWPPRASATVDEYVRMIRSGTYPFVVTLRASPPEDEDDAVAFVIDGHHKLQAYLRAGVAPRCIDIAKLSDEKTCRPDDLTTVVGGDEDLTRHTAQLLIYLKKEAVREGPA
ncbi:hypothetical protein AB0M45_25405 [Nocardia sp. NPDC051787]|uniref:hypothetical protein n=1 Tax=Nocardia sp. NPDC051787 TaxID=3155415 RepID=UPI003435F9B6